MASLKVSQFQLDVVLPDGWEGLNESEIIGALEDTLSIFNLHVVGEGTNDITKQYEEMYPECLKIYRK